MAVGVKWAGPGFRVFFEGMYSGVVLWNRQITYCHINL